MIIKTISNYIEINKLTYIVILISLLTASFRMLFFISFLIIIHELGHLLTAKLFGIEVDKIYIYPFGGIAKFHLPENYSIYKELIILINGPLFQELAKIILVYLFPKYSNIIIIYHYSILIFNLLPIYPLDGGKLINLLLSLISPYKKSLVLSIIISYIIVFIIFIININSIKLNTLILVFFLLYKINIEENNINYKYENFLLERYLNNYKFKKKKVINDSNNFYKENNHIIKDNNNYYFEEEYLIKKYKK